jgi:aminopeptidase N
VEVWYEGKYASLGGQGLIRFVDPMNGDETQFTHFEPYDAHMVFPCFDQPDIKATWVVNTVTPPEWTVVSNEEVADMSETTSSAPLNYPLTSR